MKQCDTVSEDRGGIVTKAKLYALLTITVHTALLTIIVHTVLLTITVHMGHGL
jgi:hypothetical protein